VGVELLILSLDLRVENVPLLRTGQFDTVSEASELADHSDRSGPPGSFVRRRAAFLVLDPVAGEFPIRYTKDVQPAPRIPLGPIRGAPPTLVQSAARNAARAHSGDTSQPSGRRAVRVTHASRRDRRLI
jgi:hypothetical protein